MARKSSAWRDPLIVFLTAALLITPVPNMVHFSNDLFINDHYAKRLLGALLIGLGAVTVLHYAKKNALPYLLTKRTHCLYLLLVASSVLLGAVYALTRQAYADFAADLALIASPYLYYLGVKRLRASGGDLDAFLYFAGPVLSVLTILGVKHQFSYLPLTLSMSALLMLSAPRTLRTKVLLVVVLSPAVIYYSLVGKSTLVSLVLIFLLFLLSTVPLSFAGVTRVISVLAIAMLGLAFLMPVFQSTAAYKKLAAFQFSTDPSDSDLSTGNRVFEADQVMKKVSNGAIINVAFGYGLGAYIDVGDSPDDSVLAANRGNADVRFVHVLPFFVMLKFGALGLCVYLSLMLFIGRTICRQIKLLRRMPKSSQGFYINFSCVAYLGVIAWDGQVSSGHMLANPVFWVVLFHLCLLQKERTPPASRLSQQAAPVILGALEPRWPPTAHQQAASRTSSMQAYGC